MAEQKLLRRVDLVGLDTSWTLLGQFLIFRFFKVDDRDYWLFLNHGTRAQDHDKANSPEICP